MSSDEAIEFAAKMSHQEKSALDAMAHQAAPDVPRADFLAELGLATGPDEAGIYVLTEFGTDVLSACAAANAPDDPVTPPGILPTDDVSLGSASA